MARMKTAGAFCVLFAVFAAACYGSDLPPETGEIHPAPMNAAAIVAERRQAVLGSLEKSPLGDIARFREELVGDGFVNVRHLDPTIRVELKYSDRLNFMGADVYGDLEECYLRTAAAQKLVIANSILKMRAPGMYLCVVDGLRPRRIQKRMWDLVKNTSMQPYVANPKWGSMHNYGAAVDITIVDEQGRRLDMGTPVDYFGRLAQPALEEKFLREGRLTPDQVRNRRLLREVMSDAGFLPISIEWWHFNAFEKSEVRSRYSIVE